MIDQIDWNEIEVGREYLYEEGYHLQAKVVILSKDTISNKNYIEFIIRVIDPVWNCVKDQEIKAGKTTLPEFAYLVGNQKFKPLDGLFDYMTPGFQIR